MKNYFDFNWSVGESILDFGFWILDFRLTPCTPLALSRETRPPQWLMNAGASLRDAARTIKIF
jgi:hypothetical protein